MMPPLLGALNADGPAADRAARMDLYAWLIGSWDLDVIEYHEDGSTRRRPAEWHFGWVLEGRAIQDVWIIPPRGLRQGDAVEGSNRYGTTLRTYDPRIDAWRIQWTEPVSQAHLTMIGRREGDDIVQDGRNAAGEMVRWSFREIRPESFRWFAEVSPDEGASWRLQVEFFVRRAGIPPP